MSVQYKKPSYIFNGVGMDADRVSDVQLQQQVLDTTIHIWWENGAGPNVGEIEIYARVNPVNEQPIYRKLPVAPAVAITNPSGYTTITLQGPLTEWYVKYARNAGTGDLYVTWEGKSRG